MQGKFQNCTTETANSTTQVVQTKLELNWHSNNGSLYVYLVVTQNSVVILQDGKMPSS